MMPDSPGRADLRAKINALKAKRAAQPDPPVHTADPPARPRNLRLTRASTIIMRMVRWLWDQRLPLGSLALLAGREGIGKTILSATLAADVTRGRLNGTYAGVPQSVIIVASEDSWEHTIVPRLAAADADLTRVYRVDAADVATAGVSLPEDLIELSDLIRETETRLLILDPLLSRLDARLDTHKDADVRRALEPLAALADSCNVSILGLIHVSKSASTDPLTTMMASRAFAAVARAVLFVVRDPEDPTLRLLGQPKNNLGSTDGLTTLAYRIVPWKVADTPEGPVMTGKLTWQGESPRSITDALEAGAQSGGDRTATSEAADWLDDYLTQEGGCADSADIKRDGHKAGHSIDALKRARIKLGIATKSHGFPRRTEWARSVGAGSTSHSTAPTAPTAPTVSGGRPDRTTTTTHCVQSAQSAQSAQSVGARDSALTDEVADADVRI